MRGSFTVSKDFLEELYRKYSVKPEIEDPICFPKRYYNSEDIEITAFITSIFSYGNIRSINKFLEQLFVLFGDEPAEFLRRVYPKNLAILPGSFVYRFYSHSDILALIKICSRILTTGGLQQTFRTQYKKEHPDSIAMLHGFRQHVLGICSEMGIEITNGIKFMFPDTKMKGAIKRMNLFLRWMVRSDAIDFGLWNWFPAEKLIIPLDTHIYRAGVLLGFTKRKNADLQAAREITNALRVFSGTDPVKYDFALCHLMIDGKKNVKNPFEE